MERLALLVLALCLALLGSNAYGVRSVRGAHCPTAPVQWVSDGTSDSGSSLRAPESELEGFLQCLCAEKRSAAVRKSLELVFDAAPLIDASLPLVAVFPFVLDWPVWVTADAVTAEGLASRPPPSPPPNSV